MLQEKYNLKLLHTVLHIGFNQKHLLFADLNYGVYLYSVAEKKILFGKRVFQNTIKHHVYSKAVACSDTNMFLIANAGDKTCNFYEVGQHGFKARSQIRWHKANVSSVAFSKDSTFFATGGEDGKVFIYTARDAKFYAILPIQPEYIACMHFDLQNHYFIFATFEKKIFVYDMQVCEIIIEIDTPSVAESLVFFSKNKRFLYVCKDGEIGVYDILNRQVQNRKINNVWLNQCLLHDNEKYAYIAGRENKLLIYGIDANSIVSEIELPESGVSFMRIVRNYLCICFVSGRVIFLDQKYGYKEFESFLQDKNYKEAKAFADSHNTLLKLEELYERTRLETWQVALKQIVDFFLSNQVDEALILAEPYLEDPILEKEFRYYFDEKEVISQFLLLIKREQYVQAYAMANQKRGLRKLELFKELEKYFYAIFEASKNMLEKDNVGKIGSVKKILEPFMQVAEKKEQIEFLLQNFIQYENIEQALKKQDYVLCFRLAYDFPFLQKTKSYQKAMQYCSDLLYIIKTNAHARDYNQIQLEIDFLKQIPYFKNEAEALMNFFIKQEELKKYFDKQDYHMCYQLLDHHANLYSSDIYFELENLVLNTLYKALDFAKHGATKDVFGTLKKFFDLEKWQKRIKNIFQIAYFYEIKLTNFEEKNIDCYATLKQYVDFFGKTSELRTLCELKGVEEIFEEILEEQGKKVCYLETIFVENKNA